MRIHTRVPEGVTEAPGVVVAIHGPGLDAFIEDRVDALARSGYAAAAPDGLVGSGLYALTRVAPGPALVAVP